MLLCRVLALKPSSIRRGFLDSSILLCPYYPLILKIAFNSVHSSTVLLILHDIGTHLSLIFLPSVVSTSDPSFKQNVDSSGMVFSRTPSRFPVASTIKCSFVAWHESGPPWRGTDCRCSILSPRPTASALLLAWPECSLWMLWKNVHEFFLANPTQYWVFQVKNPPANAG